MERTLIAYIKKSVENVFTTMIDIEIDPHGTVHKKDDEDFKMPFEKDIACIMGFAGEITASLISHFDENLANQATAKMLGLDEDPSHTDIRDAARAFKLALGNEKIKHEVFYINGFDTCSNIKTMDLINKYFKNIELKKGFSDFDTLISYKKAEKLLGYKPLYTWRKSDFYNWYSDKTKK